VVRSGLVRGLESVDEVFLVLGARKVSPGWRGREVPLGGSRTQGAVGEDSRGEETQESIGRQDGAARTGRERIRRGIKASKQAKLAEGRDSAAWSPEQPGSGPRPAERELIAAAGSQATARERGSR
jgi:hypothetical protein